MSSLSKRVRRFRIKYEKKQQEVEDIEKDLKNRIDRVDELKEELRLKGIANKKLETETIKQEGTIGRLEQQLRDLSQYGEGFTETSVVTQL